MHQMIKKNISVVFSIKLLLLIFMEALYYFSIDNFREDETSVRQISQVQQQDAIFIVLDFPPP